ncbi:alpha/beta hydrolase [Sphingomonas adhaesiva]|uniref:alpha/beta hydrolase n=1 Tax=Sphingomonas adhaesiva TaxID=28212 RepID=UPI002FFB2A3F
MDRREFTAASLGSAVALGTRHAVAAAAAGPSLDPLRFVDPDLRDAARREQAIQTAMGVLDDAAIHAIRADAPPAPAPLPNVAVSFQMIEGARGQPPVRIMIVNARGGDARPAIVHMHGGGFVLGALEGETRFLQEIALALDCVIVSVDYRLAPETDFRGSVADNHAGLSWTYRHAAQIGADPRRIAVMGESAGGGHAALLAIEARDRGEVPVLFQALIYPMLDDRTGSGIQPPPPIGSVGWNARNNRYGWRSFLGVEPGTPRVPAAGVPARVASVAGLPPAYIAVGGLDLFVAEDIDYARRLTEAGVPTELLVLPGMFHASERAAPEAAISRRFTRAKLDALRRAFATGR